MKRAFLYAVLALLVILIIEPNLRSSAPMQAAIPPETDRLVTMENFDQLVTGEPGRIVLSLDESLPDRDREVLEALADSVGSFLEEAGFHVYYTRAQQADSSTETDFRDNPDDDQESISPDLVLHFRLMHSDPSVRGFAILTQPDPFLESLSQAIARNLQAVSYSDFLGADSDHYANFAQLQDLSTPSILLEAGYASSDSDMEKLESAQFRETIGRAVQKAFLESWN